MAIDPQFVVSLRGKTYPLFAGVLDAATKAGLRSLTTRVVQIPSPENGHLAVVMARAEFEDGRVFEDVGDCSPASTSPQLAAAALRLASCVPLRARILTQSGWKEYTQISPGETVLAYDLAADRLQWTPLLGVSVFPEEHPTVEISSRSFRAICTADHSWPVRYQTAHRYDPESFRRKLVKTCDLGRQQGIVQSAFAEDGDSVITPREAAILGWLVTDGNVREQMVHDRWGTFGPYLRATIYQSKERYLEEIRTLLGAAASELIEKPRQRHFWGGYTSQCLPAHRWHLRAPFLRQLFRRANIESITEIPQLVLRLKSASRAAMLDAMLKAEGYERGGHWVFCQRKAWVMEAFILLATLEGKAVGIDRSKGVRPDLRAIRKTRFVNTGYLDREPGTPQPVWCPTTALGTWVMNLDGIVTITGNTRAKGRVLRDAVNVGQTLLEELPDLDGELGPDVPASGRTTPSLYVAEPQPRPVMSESPRSTPADRPAPAPRAASHPAGAPERESASPAPAANGNGKMECSNPTCGKPLTKGQHDVSLRSYGQPLCPTCQKQHTRIG